MDTFLATHSLDEVGEPLIVEAHAPLPEDLTAMLKQVGTSTYAMGFFRFVAPETMRQYFELFNLNPEKCYAFLKCAFGHLVFYQDDEYKVLDPVFNTVDTIAGKEDLEFLMDIALCDRPSLENTFVIDIYEQVYPTLGRLQLDEIYAFVPALKLGGNRSMTNVRKSKMQVEMNILSQL